MLGDYGLPRGHMALRAVVAETLAEHQIAVTADNVLLTQGSSQALDLAARRLVKPGDSVLVDDPGYPNLMFMLRFLGARLIGVPRTATGYDLAALEALLAEYKPKAFFTQPRLQSPTNSVAPISQLYRVLQLAELHDVTLVENDIYADLDPEARPSLASLDQLKRVIYIGSFSKTISPNMRVGYLLAGPGLMDELTQLKMVSGLTSSDLTERVAYGALTEGRWRKHLKALRDRLSEAHGRVGTTIDDARLRVVPRAQGGVVLVGAPPRHQRQHRAVPARAWPPECCSARATCSSSSRGRRAGFASTSLSARTSASSASCRIKSEGQAAARPRDADALPRQPSAAGPTNGAIELHWCLNRGPLRGHQAGRTNVASGSSVPVGDFRMQPFGPEIVAMVDRHARTTAVAINDFLAGAGEGQVPR